MGIFKTAISSATVNYTICKYGREWVCFKLKITILLCDFIRIVSSPLQKCNLLLVLTFNLLLISPWNDFDEIQTIQNWTLLIRTTIFYKFSLFLLYATYCYLLCSLGYWLVVCVVQIHLTLFQIIDVEVYPNRQCLNGQKTWTASSNGCKTYAERNHSGQDQYGTFSIGQGKTNCVRWNKQQSWNVM